MVALNLRDNPRIRLVLDVLRDVSRVDDPSDVLPTLAPRLLGEDQQDCFISLSVGGLPPGQYRMTRRLRVTPSSGRETSFRPHIGHPDWDDLPVHSGGFLGAIVRDDEPKLLHNLDAREDPVLGDALADMGSCMALPLFDAGRVTNWGITFRRDPEGFTLGDLEQALLTSNLVSSMTRNLMWLREFRQLNARLEHQLEEVARVQRSLLPRRMPTIPNVEIATSYLTSDQAGGDYYDFFRFDDGRWGVLIADVSGHGAAAATVVAMMHAILHGYAGADNSPDAVLRFANQRLVAVNLDGSFVTAFFGLLDPGTGRFTYARGGHNPPRLKRATGEVVALEGRGAPPLGVCESYTIESDSIRLDPRDTIVLFTDGITEAFSSTREMFGLGRLDGVLATCNGQPDCIVDSIHSGLYAHTGSRRRADDQTIVALRFLGAATE